MQGTDGMLTLNGCVQLCASDLHDMGNVGEGVCINRLHNHERCLEFSISGGILWGDPFHPPAVDSVSKAMGDEKVSQYLLTKSANSFEMIMELIAKHQPVCPR